MSAKSDLPDIPLSSKIGIKVCEVGNRFCASVGNIVVIDEIYGANKHQVVDNVESIVN
ncbi:hypothetical protein [Kaarinaea lacus]